MALNIVSFTINEEILNKMQYFYEDFRVEPSNEYVIFMAKAENCTIIIYNTLTAVFSGKQAENEATIWGYQADKKWLYNTSHGGSDEVGTGDYFGPIIVAAVYLSENDINELSKIGIKDSKKLNDQFILDICPDLVKKYQHSVLILDNEKYNSLISKNWNMNSIKAALHNKALFSLNKKVGKINFFVIDQFAEEKKYFEYIQNEKNIIRNIEFITKGESYSPSVALASMFARYTFLKYMENLSREIGYNLPLGAGLNVDEFASKLIKEKGEDILYKYAKINFKTTEKAKNLNQSNLFSE